MILEFPNIKIKDEYWVRIISECLNGWTEESLSLNNGFCQETLKFYDGLIGTVIKHGEKLYSSMDESEKEIVDSWKYQGKLYRVIHPHYVPVDGSQEPRVIMPEVNYHRMITHWTSDYTFKGLLATAKMFDDEEYIILEADTREHLAFDVNKFRQVNNAQEIYTQGENEIIFPMYRENIKEYRMTINDFIRTKNQERQLNG